MTQTEKLVSFLDTNTDMVLVENADTHYLYNFNGKVENDDDFNRKTLLLELNMYISKIDDTVEINGYIEKSYYILNKLKDASWDSIPYYRTLRKILKDYKSKEQLKIKSQRQNQSVVLSSSYIDLDNFQPTRWEDEIDEDTGEVIGGGFKPY